MGHYDTSRPENCGVCGQARGFCEHTKRKRKRVNKSKRYVKPVLIDGRDFHADPYTPDEARVAQWLVEKAGIGGGADPIGFMLASYELIRLERDSFRQDALIYRKQQTEMKQ